MKHIFLPLSVIAALTLTAGCASTPDPAKICTSEWIGKRSNTAVEKIQTKSARSLKALKKAGESWVEGKTPGPFQMFALSNAMKSLEKELTEGQGIKDLKTLSATCDDPKIISDAMSGFLNKQGLSDDLMGFVKKLDMYQRLIATPAASSETS